METRLGHSSLLISDYIVHNHGCEFTPLQLIKFVFLSHGFTLGYHGKPLIRDRIEAWKFGPVIPVLYHELKIWGDGPVRNLNYCGSIPDKNPKISKNRNELFENVIDEEERAIIDRIVENYKDWSFDDLMSLCHEPSSPWDTHYDGKFGTEIPDSTILEFYKKLVPCLTH